MICAKAGVIKQAKNNATLQNSRQVLSVSPARRAISLSSSHLFLSPIRVPDLKHSCREKKELFNSTLTGEA